MSQTKILEKKVAAIGRDVSRIHSLLASFAAEDPEGEYKQSFVARVLTASSRVPDKKFKGAKAFLAELDEV